jgi:hypothetical protein
MKEQRDNSGALFKNDRKEKDTHADYQGSVMIEGKEYWINAWIKKGNESGKTFMSLAFKPKEARAAPTSRPARNNDYDGGAPF